MRVGDVERGVGEGQLVDAARLVAEVGEPAGLGLAASRVQCLAREVEADDLAGGEPLREAPRDAAGSAADVEKAHPGS